ncbi:MAG: MATE family efflux transporter [Clostridia bacterium]|nr:MATE family efflux transporter [Clostridia bacterium]
MNSPETQHQRMTSAPVPRLLFSLSAPATVGMLVIALYSLADAYFVSSLGSQAVAAVGVVFSVSVFIQTIGYTLGMGGGSLLSRALGEKDAPLASEYATVALLGAVVAGGLITLFSNLYQKELLDFLGCTDSIYPFAQSYAIPLFYSAIPMCVTFVLSQLLRSEGKAVSAMLGLSLGSLANILLDALLIRGLGLGISGASVATLLSQCISALFLLLVYLRGHSAIRLFSGVPLSSIRHIGRILKNGLPSFFRQGLSGVATVLFNHAAAPYGEAAISALSIVQRLFLFVFSVCLGIGQGMAPIVGYNRGDSLLPRAKKAYLQASGSAALLLLGLSVPLYLFAPRILGFFRNDSAIVDYGVFALRGQALVLFTHGIVTCTILFLQSVGYSVRGTLLASARQGLFFLPLLYFLPRYYGLPGLLALQPVADALTFLFSFLFLPAILRFFRRTKQEKRVDF